MQMLGKGARCREEIGRARSELFERDVYSCQGEAERRSIHGRLYRPSRRRGKKKTTRRRERRRNEGKKGEEESEGKIAEEEEVPSCVLLNGVGVSSRGMEE